MGRAGTLVDVSESISAMTERVIERCKWRVIMGNFQPGGGPSGKVGAFGWGTLRNLPYRERRGMFRGGG